MTDPQKCIRKPGSVWTSCRCADCLERERITDKRRRWGKTTPAPSAQAWARLEELVSAGWTRAAIASAAGIPAGTVTRCLSTINHDRPRYPLGHATAKAIVAINPGDAPTQGHVSGEPARRRLRALARLGWSSTAIVAEMTAAGTPAPHQTALNKLRSGEHHRAEPETDRFARLAYDHLSMRVPPSGCSATITRNKAAKLGWLPPLAWDDDQLDDPDATPHASMPVDLDEVAVQRCAEGRIPASDLTVTERREAVRVLHGRGLSDGEIAQTLTLAPETVQRIRKRTGLPANNVEGQHSSLRDTSAGGANRSALYGGAA